MRYPTATSVQISDDTIIVTLADGRTLSVPITWYPRLAHGTADERNHWRLIGTGHGIHWPQLDEDISIENMLTGKNSGESQSSFKQWLDQRRSN